MNFGLNAYEKLRMTTLLVETIMLGLSKDIYAKI